MLYRGRTRFCGAWHDRHRTPALEVVCELGLELADELTIFCVWKETSSATWCLSAKAWMARRCGHPVRSQLLIAGPSGSGKSTPTVTLIERSVLRTNTKSRLCRSAGVWRVERLARTPSAYLRAVRCASRGLCRVRSLFRSIRINSVVSSFFAKTCASMNVDVRPPSCTDSPHSSPGATGVES